MEFYLLFLYFILKNKADVAFMGKDTLDFWVLLYTSISRCL